MNIGGWIVVGVIVALLLIGGALWFWQQVPAVSSPYDMLSPTIGAGGEFIEQEPGERPPVASVRVNPTVSASPTVSPTVSTTPSTAQALTITIDDTSFTPAELTVDVGDTVTFVNNGQGAHWPASDPHPTHTNLPEFDAKRGLATGETYTVTFTKTGAWSYHDHLNPQMKGTVTVK
jgi:plastocyanin